MLGMDKNCISAYKKGNPWMSETQWGMLYEISDKEVVEKIKEFETEHKCTVFHVIHNLFEFGECYSFLYVGEEKDYWDEEMNDLNNGYSFSYVWNKDDDFCSEFGSIGVQQRFGGLVRTA